MPRNLLFSCVWQFHRARCNKLGRQKSVMTNIIICVDLDTMYSVWCRCLIWCAQDVYVGGLAVRVSKGKVFSSVISLFILSFLFPSYIMNYLCFELISWSSNDIIHVFWAFLCINVTHNSNSERGVYLLKETISWHTMLPGKRNVNNLCSRNKKVVSVTYYKLLPCKSMSHP